LFESDHDAWRSGSRDAALVEFVQPAAVYKPAAGTAVGLWLAKLALRR
jgi:hypothetical protein